MSKLEIQDEDNNLLLSLAHLIASLDENVLNRLNMVFEQNKVGTRIIRFRKDNCYEEV